MEEFNVGLKSVPNLNAMLTLIKEGESVGLNIKDWIDKVKSIQSMISDGIVRIVLLGSFSDGKTSAIAGLLGRLEDTMKIDTDESSDELKVYRPNGLKKGFEIIDTPGLFGTKEREINGENVKYSDITKKYLSEAHIVIYVCDAVTPLKDSHVPIIKWIMRDLGKLSSSIFVINKMDEAGYDLTDDKDFARGENIKKNNLIQRLREAINLTPQEEHSLNIVCIAADPKGKGLVHWFAKSEDYKKRSHIESLRQCVSKVVDNSNIGQLRGNAALVSVKDMFVQVDKQISDITKPINKAIKKSKDSCSDLEAERSVLKTQIDNNRSLMQNQLDNYKGSLYAEIRGASVETFAEVLDIALGRQGDNVTGYVVERNINDIVQACCDNNAMSIQMAAVKFEREFNNQNSFIQGAMKQGTEWMKNASVSRKQVFAARDLIKDWFGFTYKFKPWGATNLAGNITKNLGRVAVGLSVVIEIYGWYQKYKADKELKEAKRKIIAALDDVFADVYKNFDGNTYYINFASSYLEMCKALENRNKELEDLQNKVSKLEEYQNKITNFWKNKGEYVSYE